MACDIFLKIADVKGEAGDAKHTGEIEILSWSWGASQAATFMGGGAGAARVDLQSLSLMKYADKSSATLLKFCCSGKHIKEVNLVTRKASGDKEALEYHKITLDEAIVTSWQQSCSGNDLPTESISLSFSRFKHEYTPQKSEGDGEPSVHAGWDTTKNEEVV